MRASTIRTSKERSLLPQLWREDHSTPRTIDVLKSFLLANLFSVTIQLVWQVRQREDEGTSLFTAAFNS